MAWQGEFFFFTYASLTFQTIGHWALGASQDRRESSWAIGARLLSLFPAFDSHCGWSSWGFVYVLDTIANVPSLILDFFFRLRKPFFCAFSFKEAWFLCVTFLISRIKFFFFYAEAKLYRRGYSESEYKYLSLRYSPVQNYSWNGRLNFQRFDSILY